MKIRDLMNKIIGVIWRKIKTKRNRRKEKTRRGEINKRVNIKLIIIEE